MIFPLLPLAVTLAPAAPPTGTPGPPDIRSIVPPQVYYMGGSWFWLVYAGAFLALAALVLWWLLRGPRRPAAPPLSPREVALRRLRELEASVDTLDARAFGAAVADVLRVYIGAQYGLQPQRQTSEEFLASITGSRAFSIVEHALLTEFLAGCDQLKFARADATLGNKRRLLRQAGDFLEDSVQASGGQAVGQSLTLGV